MNEVVPQTEPDPQAPSEEKPQTGWSVRKWLVIGTFVLIGPAAIGILMAANQRTTTPIYGYELVSSFPHDPGAFCQGLIIVDGQMYEGTGQNGRSTLRKVDLETGQVERSISLNQKIFGEGIAAVGDSIVQLTWKQRRAYVFDRATFAHQKTFTYAGEGWGLTHDGTHFIMSDGTTRLRFLDTDTFKEVRRITVHDGRRRIDDLNELEYVNGEIYANVWYNDAIARISPKDGTVLGWIDLNNLWPAKQRPDREHVLNGIAYDSNSDRLFVTGKNWPKLYEIRVSQTPR